MMRNLFTKTLYQKRFFALWWFLGVAAMTALTLSFFPSFNTGEFDAAFANLPEAIKQIAGDAASLKTVDGYVTQQLFALRVPLLGIILAIALFVGLSAGDEQRGLTETQLAGPMSRTGLLTQKILAGVVITAVALAGGIVGILVALALIGESLSLAAIGKYSLNCLLILLAYGSVALLVAAATGRRGLAIGISSAVAFVGYLINSMAPSVSYLSGLDKLTFFHYYDNSPLTLANMSVLAGVSVVLILASLVLFNRRDIRSQ